MVNEKIFPELLNLTECCFRKSADEIKKLRFDGTSRQQTYCVCLYCRILELAQDGLRLVKFRQYISLPILLRSMLEVLVDLENLIKFPNYWKTMHANALKQQRKLGLAATKSATNPFLKTISVSENVTEKMSEIELELKQLKEDGHIPNLFEERFKTADMSHEYDSFYTILCMRTHPNLYDLQSKYIYSADGHIRVCIFEPQNIQDACGDIALLLDILIMSSEKIHKMLNSGISFENERILFQQITNAESGSHPSS
jgi:hypothetical protein